MGFNNINLSLSSLVVPWYYIKWLTYSIALEFRCCPSWFNVTHKGAAWSYPIPQWVPRSTATRLVICPIAIAYSMGQIIKPVCICFCVSVRTLTVAFLDRFSPKLAQTKKTPKSRNKFIGGQHRTTSSPIPPNFCFRPRGPENSCKY